MSEPARALAATGPGEPTRAARGGHRSARAAVSSLSALGEPRRRPRPPVQDRTRALALTLRHLCTIHAIAIEVVGDLPDWPCLLVANHVSDLDPLVILSQIPAVPLAKGEVAQWPIVGATAAALGVRFVDLEAAQARARLLREVIATLRSGVSVLNFPEGTTTDGSRVRPFHRGGFGAAMIAQVPVVPLALRFDDVDARRGVRARLEVLPAMWGYRDDRPEAFAVRARAAIARALATQQPT